MAGLVFLFREAGEWRLRRRTHNGTWVIELAEVDPGLPASTVFDIVQRRLADYMVVVEGGDGASRAC